MRMIPIFPAVDCQDCGQITRQAECDKCPIRGRVIAGMQRCLSEGIFELTIFNAIECPMRAGRIIDADNCPICEHDGGTSGNEQGCLFIPDPEPIDRRR